MRQNLSTSAGQSVTICDDALSLKDALLLGKAELPAVPAVASKVITLLNNQRTNATELAKAMTWDPALALKLLRIANSAVYRRRIPTDTVEGAIVRIGLRRTRDVVYGLAARSLSSGGGYVDPRIWEEAVAVAIASQLLGRTRGIAHDAFIAGLLHNVGKTVLCLVSAEKYEEALEFQRESGGLDRGAEQVVFGVNHNSVGGELLGKWGMRRSIVESTRWYNQIGIAPQLTPSARIYASLVHLSVRLVGQCGVIDGEYREWNYLSDPVARWFGMDEERVETWRGAFVESYKRERTILL